MLDQYRAVVKGGVAFDLMPAFTLSLTSTLHSYKIEVGDVI